jgi:arylsulfatase A-like enzyme
MAAPGRPNVLWIVADQLRYAALGCTGDPNVATPHIDRLAAEGVSCQHAISQYPVCVPYRASLFSGRFSPGNGVERHGDFLDPNAITIAHAFTAAGYSTTFTGKWHLAPECGAAAVTPGGWIGQEYWVHPRFRGGFGTWQGFNIANNYYETYIARGESVAPERLPSYQTDALTDLAIGDMAGRSLDAPWFHVVAYESPHPGAGGSPRSPGYPVPEAYERMLEPDDIELRANVPPAHEAEARLQLAGYYRLIANLDDNVGRLLTFLDERGLAESTLVLFASDHGEMGGSRGLRHKHVPFEESVHVPCIWRQPGRLPAGTTWSGLLCGPDVHATTLALANVDRVGPVDGIDQSAGLRGDARAKGRDAVLLQWETPRFAFGDHPYRGVRTERFTYVVGRDETFDLLFDRMADPYELDNRFDAPSAAAVRGQLHARLESLLHEIEGGVPPYVAAKRPRREPS